MGNNLHALIVEMLRLINKTNMKKIISIFIVLTVIISSCSISPEKKAQKAIKDYLQKNLNDAKSYESVEFSLLCKDETTIKNTKFGKELDNLEFDCYADSLGMIDSKKEKDYQMLTFYKTKFKNDKLKYSNTLDQYRDSIKNFKSEFVGYLMTHKYRAKNKMGGYILESALFIMDKNFNIKEVFPN
jgi:hypothetical protein